MTRIAVVGASGYAGGEMARLLLGHPRATLGTLYAGSNAGRAIRDIHPHLRGLDQKSFAAVDIDSLVEHDVVVLALPHGQSGQLGEQLISHNPDLVLVDLGADRRLHDSAAWAAYYGGEHFQPWVYGVPELPLADGSTQREALRGAKRIAAPGCNASAVSIALAPLVRRGIVQASDIVATLAVAPSGAGRALREDLLAAERISSATAYAAGGSHRHIPEIAQVLHQAGAEDVTVTLTPILTPLSRGILAVTSAMLMPGVSESDVHEVLSDAYGGEPFVDLVGQGALPTTGSVLGSNTVAIGVAVDQQVGRITIVSALDNLVKGTAGAAVQSVNIALGWEETEGLTAVGVAP